MIVVKLESVCEIGNGYAFKSYEYRQEGVPLLRISSFNNGPVFIDDKTVYLDETHLVDKDEYVVSKGDILIALSGATTGKYGIYNYDYPSLLNQRVGVLKSGSSKSLNHKYFFYYLDILQKEIYRKAGGAAQPNISTKAISGFKIPLPPLAEQKKIAAILDAADEYRKKTKALIDKYDELTQSLFLDMFGDPVTNPNGYELKKLSDVVKHGKIITYGIVQAGPEFIGGIPYIRTGDIKQGRILINRLKKTSPIIANSYERSKCSAGDIIMSIRATVGTVAILPTELNGANLTQGTARISVNEEVCSTLFIFKSIQSRGIQLKIERQTKGATFKEITLTRLRAIKIPIPPLKLQNQFSKRVQAIENQKAQAESSLAQAEDLFQSLLQRAFKGEL